MRRTSVRIALALLLLVAGSSSCARAEWHRGADQYVATQQCEKRVRDRMPGVSTLAVNDQRATSTDDNRWSVRGTMFASYASGVAAAYTYECDMEYVGRGEWWGWSVVLDDA